MAFTRFAHRSHKLLMFCLLRFYKNNSDNKGLKLVIEARPVARGVRGVLKNRPLGKKVHNFSKKVHNFSIQVQIFSSKNPLAPV